MLLLGKCLLLLFRHIVAFLANLDSEHGGRAATESCFLVELQEVSLVADTIDEMVSDSLALQDRIARVLDLEAEQRKCQLGRLRLNILLHCVEHAFDLVYQMILDGLDVAWVQPWLYLPKLEMVERKRAGHCEFDRIQLKRRLVHLQVEDMLRLAFSLDETRTDRTARLQKMHAVLLTLEDLRYAFVLVGPDDEMKKLWYHVLRYTVAATAAKVHTFVLVLM